VSSNSVPSGPSNRPIAQKYSFSGIFAALRISAFRKFWIGLLGIFLGSQMAVAAQAWLAYELTHSPLKLTLVTAMGSIPWIALSLYSGVIIDRFQKRNVIVASQIATVGVAAIIGTLIATGNIQYWHLLVASFTNGISGAFYMTARNSIIAELVPRESLYNAISLNNVSMNIAFVGGPAIAGILIGAFGTQSAYFVAIGCLLIGTITMGLLPASSKLGQVKVGSIFANLREGINYIRGKRTIVVLLVMELVITIFGMCYSGLMPVFAELLNLKSEGYGFLLAASGIGATLGSLALASLGNFKRKGRILIGSGIGLALILLLFANTVYLSNYFHLGSFAFAIMFILLLGTGATANNYSVTSGTIVQLSVSDEYRGRATSVYSMVVAVFPLANLILGTVAEFLGAPLALTIYGVILTIFMVGIAFFSRPIRTME
jgi:MFS family permease